MNILHHNPLNLSKINRKIPISENSVYWFGSEEVEKIFEFFASRSKISFQKRTGTRISRKNLIHCWKFIGEFKATKIFRYLTVGQQTINVLSVWKLRKIDLIFELLVLQKFLPDFYAVSYTHLTLPTTSRV